MASSFLLFHETGARANYSNIFYPTSGVQSKLYWTPNEKAQLYKNNYLVFTAFLPIEYLL